MLVLIATRPRAGSLSATRGGSFARLTAVVACLLGIVLLAHDSTPAWARSHRSSSGDDGDSKSKSKSKGRHSRKGEAKPLDPAFIDRINAMVASRDFAAANHKLHEA